MSDKSNILLSWQESSICIIIERYKNLNYTEMIKTYVQKC